MAVFLASAPLAGGISECIKRARASTIAASGGRTNVKCLARRVGYDQGYRIMKQRPLRHIPMLVLGILMALGTGLSLAQANGMAVDMALASNAGTPGHDGCSGCPDDGGAQGACHTACAPAIAAVMPVAPGLALSGFQPPEPLAAVLATGWSSPPDPSPPKAGTPG